MPLNKQVCSALTQEHNWHDRCVLWNVWNEKESHVRTLHHFARQRASRMPSPSPLETAVKEKFHLGQRKSLLWHQHPVNQSLSFACLNVLNSHYKRQDGLCCKFQNTSTIWWVFKTYFLMYMLSFKFFLLIFCLARHICKWEQMWCS